MGAGLAQQLAEGRIVVWVVKDLGSAVAAIDGVVTVAADGGASGA